MKKLLVILLSAALLLTLAACGKTAGSEASEPPEEELVYEPLPETALPLAQRLAGDWYAGYQGLALTLSLAEDGSYSFRFPGREDQTGAWVLNDENLLCLDGEDGETLLPVGDTLRWASAGLLFTRERPEVYVPGEIVTDAEPGALNGYWKSQFVALGDGTILASALDEKTDIYIEGTRVALGGPLFGDIIVDMTMKDGTLTYEKEGVNVSLTLQQDGLLRLSVNGENPVTVYLLSAVPGWAEPEGAEPEPPEVPEG